MRRPKDILIIPRHKVILRFIELPSLDPLEIKGMMEFQIFKELPCQKEDIVSGFRNIGSYRKGFSYIMLAAAKRQYIKEIAALKKAKPGNIRLETELLYLYLLKKGIARQSKAILILYFCRDYLEIMILDDAKPVLSRGIGSAAEWPEEVKRSLASYKRHENSREIEGLAVMHDAVIDRGHVELAIKRFFPIPYDFYEYKNDLNGADMPLEIDLSPMEHSDNALKKSDLKQFFLTFFLLFIAMAVSVSFFIFKAQERNKILLEISEKTGSFREEADQLDVLLKKTMLLKCQRNEGERTVNIIKEYCELMPRDMILTGMDYDDRGVLSCSGTARYMSGVFDFVKVLEKSRYFKKVEVKRATKKETRDRKLTDFDIACFAR